MQYVMQLSDLVSVTQGELINGDCLFSQLTTDTRTICKGDVYLALSGEHFDGHTFCQQAFEAGAIAVIVEKAVALNDSIPQLIVKSCHLALGIIAKTKREKYQGPLIAVTGSNGKTTTKELIASILTLKGNTLATQGNLNNQIGVPLTLLRFAPEHAYAVVEMGANAKGEIAYCTHLAQPDVAIITNAMAAHLEGFGSLQGVVDAKGEIFQGLKKTGIGILNLDDKNIAQWLPLLTDKKVLTFSLQDATADVYATDLNQLSAGNYQFTLVYKSQSCSVTLQLLAVHNVKNALAAAASVFAIGGTMREVVEGLEQATAIGGRLKSVAGIDNATVIDDSYNGNPDSVKAAIDLLALLEGCKILALGDMGELGADEKQLHASIGVYAANKKIDYLLSCGPMGALAAAEFSKLTDSPAKIFENREQMIIDLKKMINSDSKILVKGSLSAGMKEVVNALTQEVQD